MSQQPTPNGGQNQTLLELIYSLKGLAQTVEFFHQDLSRKLDAEAKARARDIDKLRDALSKNQQAINILPITFSDRTEKLLNKLNVDIGEKLRDVEDSILEVRNKLEGYSRTAERAISQTEADHEAIAHEVDSKADITGRIEVDEKGDVKLQFNSKLLKKIWTVILILAAGGGAFGLKEAFQYLFGNGK